MLSDDLLFEKTLIRVRQKYKEEEESKLKRKVVLLDKAPGKKELIISCNSIKNKSKKTRILEFIQDEFLSDIFKQEFWKYKKSLLKYKNLECIKFLESLSKKYEIDLGMLHGIPGNFTETKEPELKKIIDRYSETFKVVPKVSKPVEEQVEKIIVDNKKPKRVPMVFKRITTILNKRKVKA